MAGGDLYITSMLRNLNAASERLDTEIDQYLFICSGVHDLCLQGNATHNVPAEHYQKVTAELDRVVFHGAKLRLAHIAIMDACNGSFGCAPINSMPSEILTHTFHFVMRDERYLNSSLQYPDYLTHVCSRWRSVALASPALWTRISFTYQNRPTRQDILSRAKLHAARAGQLPLEVYITDSYKSSCCHIALEEFLVSIASRIKVFAFDIQDEFALSPTYGEHNNTEPSEYWVVNWNLCIA
ncbi:hypothetical protein B0J17DRAFT_715091 [Rhizoctonia solani]|nr:hypothetical protein B0J17DRAFT_715091 [Rhizoctonia solani]